MADGRIQVIFHKEIKHVTRRMDESILAHDLKRPSTVVPKPKAPSRTEPKHAKAKDAAPDWTNLPDTVNATVLKARWDKKSSDADEEW